MSGDLRKKEKKKKNDVFTLSSPPKTSNKLHYATLTMSDSQTVYTSSERLNSKVGREAVCQTKKSEIINRSCHRHASWGREKKKTEDMVCASAKFNRKRRVTVQLLLQQMHVMVID